ncbi:glycosyltransferase family 4 protein [Alienimonas californiensis]|uniref:Alpha-D-kanosaminyltransferase n=1 Tax=Alienimonas californiensis TaxID=2527989 RepID=A0A517P805_9PLAN|nr:glycosyltransferase family 4 protein [Alienimonas californiensis]QDT15492.1 Alpha-D-kanosaminyltransferase [Alienimonas californiensis]
MSGAVPPRELGPREPGPNRPLRVLTAGHSYVTAANRAIAREVARDPAFEVTVAAPAVYHGDFRREVCEPEQAGSPLRIEPIPARWTRRVHVFRYNARVLRRLTAGGGFDAVHAWEEPYILAGYQIAKAAAAAGVPYGFRSAQSLNKTYPPPFRQFERAALRTAAGWVAGGSLVFENLVSRGYPERTGRIITLAVETARFRPLPPEAKRAVREELGLPGPLIVQLGRVNEDKGVRVLLAALEGLGERPWGLLMLGNGPLEGEVLRWAEARGWGDRVRVGAVRHEEVPRRLAAADLLVAPSQTTPHWKEQFGRMLIEAFACGVPVIGSDSGEIPRVVGDAGRIVPEADAAAWTRVIRELLDDPAARADLAERGLQRCGQYSVAAVAERWKDFYRDLAAAGSAGAAAGAAG